MTGEVRPSSGSLAGQTPAPASTPASRPTPARTPALKEWSAAIHALLDGRQTILLRKGGIHEKRFEVAASRFLLFPTVAHSHAERVRPEHRDLLDEAARDSTDDEVLVRAGARVVAVVEVRRPENLEQLASLHIWTDESVRLDFRPRHRLTAVVVSAAELREPVRVQRTPDHRGCASWVQLPVRPDWSDPVHDGTALERIADRVRDSVG